MGQLLVPNKNMCMKRPPELVNDTHGWGGFPARYVMFEGKKSPKKYCLLWCSETITYQ